MSWAKRGRYDFALHYFKFKFNPWSWSSFALDVTYHHTVIGIISEQIALLSDWALPHLLSALSILCVFAFDVLSTRGVHWDNQLLISSLIASSVIQYPLCFGVLKTCWSAACNGHSAATSQSTNGAKTCRWAGISCS